MYHVEQNVDNEDVSFIRDFLHTSKATNTAYYIGVYEFSPRFVTRIRHNTSDKRFARLTSNYQIFGSTRYGMNIYQENEHGMFRIGSTNAPSLLMKNFRIFLDIDLAELMPDYAVMDEYNKNSLLLHTIEKIMYSDDRKIMKALNVIIDYHSVIHSTLPITFFTMKSAADFVEKYQRETGEKCYFYNRKMPEGYKDDVMRLAAILEKIRFNGPDSEDR